MVGGGRGLRPATVLGLLLLIGGLLAGCGTTALPANGMGEAGDGTDPFVRQPLDPWAVSLPDVDQHHLGATTAAAQHRVGQSFRATQANLHAVAVRLVSPPNVSAGAVFRLATSADGSALRTVPLTQADWGTNPYLTVNFPPLPDSAGQLYWAEFSAPAVPISTTLVARMSDFDSYSAGAATLDGQAQRTGDLTFRTFYSAGPLDLLGDAGRGLADNAGFALAALLFLLLPGGALLQWTSLLTRTVAAPGLSGGQRLLAAPGVSLLVWPVLLLAAHLTHITMSGPRLWAGLALAGLALAGGLWREWQQTRLVDGAARPRLTFSDGLFWTTLALVTALTLGSRLRAIRDLAAGLGIDAYHHTAIAVLFLRDGGIPDNYAPYAPLASFTYHFGFHAWVAALGWLHGAAGLDLPTLMPLAGQAMGALLVPTFTLFGWRVLGSRWLGLTAAGLAGLVCIFPAYYVNWSRYPQLLGVVLLPVAWTLLFEALAPLLRPQADRSPERADLPADAPQPWRVHLIPALLAGVTAAGLFLSHYRLFLMYVTYAGGYGLWLLLNRWLTVRRTTGARWAIGGLAARTAMAGLVAATILLPWLLNVRANFIVRFSGSTDPRYHDIYDIVGRLGNTPILYWSTAALLILAGLGLLWALWRRDVPALLLGWWLGLHLLLGTPNGLPGSGYVDSITVATSAFLPVCLLAALALVRGGSWLLARAVTGQRLARHPTWQTALVVGGVLIGGYGALRALPLIEAWPFITAADRTVLAQLAATSPPQARVLAAAFTYPWAPQTPQGADGGLWAPLLADRATSVPMLPAYNERVPDPTYFTTTQQLAQAQPGLMAGQAAAWATLRAAGITHLYIGSRSTVLDPARLLAQPAQVTLLAHQDDAWLFRLK
ncbi:MAG: hypothetical protein M3Z04_22270 [Chloroflexota bacterium]|nr:hypothetical protein [Chloroflexota bacterium]